MKIVVAIKQVPERDTPIRLSNGPEHPESAGRSLDLSGATWILNEPDAFALEQALQLRERTAAQGREAEVVVLTAGPRRATAVLRKALATGADRALHIHTAEESPAAAAPDTLTVAHFLADAIRAEAPDLVLTGSQSGYLGSGQTGPVLAELLGLPHATLAHTVDLEGEEGSVQRFRVKRELEDGWFQHVTLPLPALLTVQSGGTPLRYATLLGIKRARTKPLIEVKPNPAPPHTSHAEVVRLSPGQRKRQTTYLHGTPAEIATQLIEKLRFEARVL